MSENTDELLRKILELEEENNKLLKKMRRNARWSAFFSLLYWVIVLGGAAAAFYYVQPILQQMIKAYESVAASAKKAGTTFDAIDPKALQGLQDALKKLGGEAQ